MSTPDHIAENDNVVSKMTEINVNKIDDKADKSINKNVKKGVDMVAKIEKKITTDINVNKADDKKV